MIWYTYSAVLSAEKQKNLPIRQFYDSIRTQCLIGTDEFGRCFMDQYVIRGGTRLQGEVEISGAKNAAVAIIPAALLVQGVCRIENIPQISDTDTLLTILAAMAEQESRTISANIKWAYQKKFEKGEVTINTGLMLGYEKAGKTEDGRTQYRIIEDRYRRLRNIRNLLRDLRTRHLFHVLSLQINLTLVILEAHISPAPVRHQPDRRRDQPRAQEKDYVEALPGKERAQHLAERFLFLHG